MSAQQQPSHSRRDLTFRPNGFICARFGSRIGFVRLFGYGLHWKDTRRHRLLWSERERIYVQWSVGPWVLTPLRRGERGFRRARP